MSNQAHKIVKSFAFASLTSLAIAISGVSYANSHIDSAEKYLKNNEVNAAIIELKNAIQASPKNAQPRIMLGEVYLAKGNFAGARKELSRAKELGGNKAALLPLFVRALSGLGKYEEAINIVDKESVSDPYAKTELFALKAAAEINLGKLEAAEYSLQLAKDSSLDTIYTQLGEARLDAARRNSDAALQTVNRILKQTADNSDVWLLKGHLETSKKDFNSALTSYTKAYELSPYAIQYTIFIARTLVYSKNFEEADKYLNRLLEASPNHVFSNELMAMSQYSRQNFEEAKEHADRSIHNGSDKTASYLISGVSAYELQLFEQAYNTLKKIDSRLPNDHFAKRLMIATQLRLGYIDEAEQSMGALDVDSTDSSLFLSKASMQLAELGRDEKALELAQKASAQGSTGSELMLGLIKLAGNDQTGLDNLRSAIAKQPDKRLAELGLARYLIKLKLPKEAEAIADDWLNTNPDDIEAIILKGLTFQAQKQFDNADNQFDKALAINPEHLQSLTSMAQVKANKQEWEDAYRYSYKASTLSPGNNAISSVALISANRVKRLPEYIQLIEEQLKTAPSNITLIHTKARALALIMKFRESIAFLENLAESEKNSDTWSLLGNIYYTLEKWYDAEKAYAKWLELSPTNIKAHVRNIHISEKTKKLGAGIQLAKNAEKMFPSDVRFPIMKAGLLFKSGKPEASQKVLDNLDENAKETPVVLLIQGLLHAANQNYEAAIKVHKKRYDKKPGLVTANELASLYVINGQSSKAIDFLTTVIKENPLKARALEIRLADIKVKTDPDGAIEQYLAIAKREPTNIVALNNLAWLYTESNRIADAKEYAERAYKIGSKSPGIADTYGYILLKSGVTDQAVKILEKAYRQKQDNPEIALHYSESLIENNQGEMAKRILSNVITEDPKLVVLKSALEKRLNEDKL